VRPVDDAHENAAVNLPLAPQALRDTRFRPGKRASVVNRARGCAVIEPKTIMAIGSLMLLRFVARK
jgi:hypothetical protein